jgi:PAS domain S-box-containing protein
MSLKPRLRTWLPTSGTLPDGVWRTRHRGILALLWLHVPALLIFALLQGETFTHSLSEASAVAVPAVAALLAYRRRRLSTILASVGLVSASAVLVHLSGGTIEAHFHFFIMVGVVVLYQDWWPFGVAIAFVTLHHGIAGALAPLEVYNHPSAIQHPWRWAAIHGLAILGMSAAGFVNWRLNESLQRATQDRERKLAEAQELAHLGSWQRERATGSGRWSDEQYRLLGFVPQSVPPTIENLLGRVHPDDVDVLSEAMAKTWESGTSFAIDFRVMLPDGSRRWLHGRGEVSEWDGPVATRMHGTNHDVTASRLADEARRASEARYRKLVETSQEGIWSFDTHSRTTFVNRRMAEMLGYEPDEMLGQSLLDYIIEGGPDSTEPGDPWRREPQHDCRFRRRDGSDLWGLVSLSWEPSVDGGSADGLATVTDITVRKQAEASLAAARDQATQASQLKSRFLANTSHEIRTPMTVILGMNELLLETDLDETQRRFTEGVARAASGLLALINDILELSKIEAGKLELEIDDFELPRLVNEVVAMLADTGASKGLQLVSQCDPEVPPVVRGDAGRLRQILVNLVSNGLKFTDRGGVAVRVSRPSDEVVRFEVSDSGIGIAPEDQWRIFRPFSQVDGSNTRRHGGTGLGLVICKQLVEAMGGTIDFTSTPGSGSTFRLDVPFRTPTTAPLEGGGPHLIQVYESEAFLVTCVSRFVAAGLDAGEAAVVVATPAHRRSFDAALEGVGIDVSTVRGDGRYLTLDAGEALSMFMVDGTPDPSRFNDRIGTLVAEAAAGGRPVRVFGEMVALLWAEHNVTAALRLEELWNELGQRQAFSLLCAYPAHSFAGTAGDPQARDVCALHSGVIPATPTAAER